MFVQCSNWRSSANVNIWATAECFPRKHWKKISAQNFNEMLGESLASRGHGCANISPPIKTRTIVILLFTTSSILCWKEIDLSSVPRSHRCWFTINSRTSRATEKVNCRKFLIVNYSGDCLSVLRREIMLNAHCAFPSSTRRHKSCSLLISKLRLI